MNPIQEFQLRETRRYFFGKCAAGIGGAALASVMKPQTLLAETAVNESAGVMPALHHAPTAKRVIWLFMADGPSQMDLFDYKPKMEEYFDKDLPESVRNGQRITTMTSGQARFPIAPTLFKFRPHGECGALVSELLPTSTPPIVVAIQPSVSVELAQAAVLSCSQAISGGAYSAMPVMMVQPMTKTVSQPPMRLHHSRERSL